MRRRLYLPEEVREDIGTHIREAVERARVAFYSGAEEEDALTGQLGGLLQIGNQRVFVPSNELPGVWTWSMSYTKFRGRGPRATESYLGADGLFELILRTGAHVDRKSLLFQAKIGGNGGRDLVEQVLKLSTWREAAIVVVYDPESFQAYSLDEVLAHQGALRGKPGSSLAELLAGDYLECTIGDDELVYDARRAALKWRAMNGEVVMTKFSVRHRVRVNVKAPEWKRDADVDLVVNPEEVYRHRMQATDGEILSYRAPAHAPKPKNVAKALAALYHPDRFNTLDEIFRNLANRRTEEINVARDRTRRRAV